MHFIDVRVASFPFAIVLAFVAPFRRTRRPPQNTVAGQRQVVCRGFCRPMETSRRSDFAVGRVVDCRSFATGAGSVRYRLKRVGRCVTTTGLGSTVSPTRFCRSGKSAFHDFRPDSKRFSPHYSTLMMGDLTRSFKRSIIFMRLIDICNRSPHSDFFKNRFIFVMIESNY